MIVELYFTVDGASELSVLMITVVGDVFCMVVDVVSGAFVDVSGAFVVIGSGFFVLVEVVVVRTVVDFGASVVDVVKIRLVGSGALVVDSVYDLDVIM